MSRLVLWLMLASACATARGCGSGTGAGGSSYDPLALSRASERNVENLEAAVPPMCYTKTAGVSNVCWTCHVSPRAPNLMDDWELQEEYAFSDVGLTNHWTNLFRDRRAAVEAIADGDALAYIRQDNYEPLRAALRELPGFPGWKPDLDFAAGFDSEGFSSDGGGWRAVRYKPFPGTFWPTNGSTDDVFVRLPARFRQDAAGAPNRAIYKVNLSILEAAVAADPRRADAELEREVEPLDEAAAGIDLDRDGRVGGTVSRIRGLPARYAGGASDTEVRRYLYPAGVEFLHTVRYVDPDEPRLLSARMKEVRYSVKRDFLDDWASTRAYERELDDKLEGLTPVYRGAPEVGLRNDFGWQLQGWIEDSQGRLRLQTDEEHRFCMGCHSTLGVTVDQTFALPRKVPGATGWAPQDLAGIPDVPQAGHADPEILTYFRRGKGGDEFRANTEVLDRF
ncbi:MAG: hypothetical protein ACREID_05390, partial [Planctomycetota bacterium]